MRTTKANKYRTIPTKCESYEEDEEKEENYRGKIINLQALCSADDEFARTSYTYSEVLSRISLCEKL